MFENVHDATLRVYPCLALQLKRRNAFLAEVISDLKYLLQYTMKIVPSIATTYTSVSLSHAPAQRK